MNMLCECSFCPLGSCGSLLLYATNCAEMLLDLAFSSFPRMKCVAVGVGDRHPPQRSLGRYPKPHAWPHGSWERAGAASGRFRKLWDPMRGVVGDISGSVSSARLNYVLAGAPPEDQIAHSEIVVRDS